MLLKILLIIGGARNRYSERANAANKIAFTFPAQIQKSSENKLNSPIAVRIIIEIHPSICFIRLPPVILFNWDYIDYRFGGVSNR